MRRPPPPPPKNPSSEPLHEIRPNWLEAEMKRTGLSAGQIGAIHGAALARKHNRRNLRRILLAVFVFVIIPAVFVIFR